MRRSLSLAIVGHVMHAQTIHAEIAMMQFVDSSCGVYPDVIVVDDVSDIDWLEAKIEPRPLEPGMLIPYHSYHYDKDMLYCYVNDMNDEDFVNVYMPMPIIKVAWDIYYRITQKFRTRIRSPTGPRHRKQLERKGLSK